MHETHFISNRASLRFAVITVSSSRYRSLLNGERVSDPSGDLAESMIKMVGHEVVLKEIVPDNKEAIVNMVNKSVALNVDIVVTIGGTGPTKSDQTINAIQPLFSKKLEGFGEIFRFLSYKQVGPLAYLSNATAGIANQTVIFCIPGSPKAVKLALKELILPTAKHLVQLIHRKD